MEARTCREGPVMQSFRGRKHESRLRFCHRPPCRKRQLHRSADALYAVLNTVTAFVGHSD